MLAYDLPLSALLFILDVGVPEEYTSEMNEEETLAYIEMLRKIQKDGNDGL